MSLPSRTLGLAPILRALLIAVAVVALGSAATGCSLLDRSVEEQIEDFDYDDAGAKEGFVDGCASKPYSDVQTCNRLFDCLEQHVPVEKFRAIVLAFAKERTLAGPDALGEKATRCVRRVYDKNPMATGGYTNPQLFAAFQQECLKAAGARNADVAREARAACEELYQCVSTEIEFEDYYRYESAIILREKLDKATDRKVTRCATKVYSKNPGATGGYDNPELQKAFVNECVKGAGDVPGVKAKCRDLYACVKASVDFEDFYNYDGPASTPEGDERFETQMTRCAGDLLAA